MSASCVICGETNQFSIWRQEQTFQLLHCETCGLVFQDPYPTPSTLDDLYNDEYHETRAYDGVSSPDGVLRKQMYLTDAAHLEATIGKHGSILDIGCAEGTFLAQLSEGWNRFGVEISPYAVKRAEEKGISIFCGHFEDYDPQEPKFDVVLMRGVFEHLVNPKSIAQKCRSILKDGGWLVLSNTPNIGAMGGKLFKGRYRWVIKDEHINLYTLPTLERLLNDTGFNITKVVYPYFRTPKAIGELTYKEVETLTMQIAQWEMPSGILQTYLKGLKFADLLAIVKALVSSAESPCLPGDVFTIYARAD